MTDEQQDTQPSQDVPPGVVVAANGVWRDADTGQFVGGGGGSTRIQTPQQATALANRRWQLQAQAEAAARGGLRRITGNSLAAWADIVAAQGQLAQDTDKGRSSTEAARFVGQAAGFLGDRRQDGQGGAGGITINVPADTVRQLLEHLAARRGGGSDPAGDGG